MIMDQYYMELKNKLSNRPILLDNTNDFSKYSESYDRKY